ncbi:FAD binding domain protein [Hypoxylon rubiginosum]|uniref:FAD binding domain protein n=1 Tax=Hypoxylon rubiginosum TaxID=110542 RepID=A0ACB9YQ52_9PEZI|nr:FAD binding domain protein [Hypoxylon rubiginosum]
MKNYVLAFFCVYLRLFPVSSATVPGSNSSASLDPVLSESCQVLGQRFPNQLHWPGTEQYTNETSLYWSRTTLVTPYCIFTPENANHVSAAVIELRRTQTQFAVRSGGHMPVKGAAGTNQGVLIAMTRMNSTALSTDGSIASVGPGLRWGDVYNWLSTKGRVVVGGRYAPVGVSGVLLGGGLSYFSATHGWAANNVVNFELVLANGTIASANATANPDLFWALKGSSSNHGIVVRFDLQTYPASLMYAGTISYDEGQVQGFLHAFQNWLAPGGGIQDKATAIVPALFIYPGQRSVQANVVVLQNNYTLNQTVPKPLQGFVNISSTSNTAHVRTYPDFLTETTVYGNRSGRNTFYATSLLATGDAVRLINETVPSIALSMLGDVENSFVGLSMQPVTKSHLQAARDAGGDAIDLDPNDGDFIAFNLVVEYTNEQDDAAVTAFNTAALHALNTASKAANIYYPFQFLNDAGAGEQVFSLYGKGKSLARMKSIRSAYDPDGIFQDLMPGGFKIGV